MTTSNSPSSGPRPRALWLDDVRPVPAHLEDTHEVVVVRTVREMIAALHHHGPFDMFSLDHDLGWDDQRTIPVWDVLPDGRDAARLLCLSDHARDVEIRVHSWNPPAAREMVEILQDGGFTGAFYREYHTYSDEPAEGGPFMGYVGAGVPDGTMTA